MGARGIAVIQEQARSGTLGLKDVSSKRYERGVDDMRTFLFTVLFCLISRTGFAYTTEVYATAEDGTPLTWDVYQPITSPPYPVALVIHGGSWRTGSSHGIDILACAQDLADAGYLALSIEYRLAPPGKLPGQSSSGRYPDQTHDVTLAIIAARLDARCNGKVVAVGGSSGGTHAVVGCTIGTPGFDRLDSAVSLSGAYDFSDRTPDPHLEFFVLACVNYCGVTGLKKLQDDSPVDIVTSDISPVLMFETRHDFMPVTQLGDMTARLDALGVTNYQSVTLPGSHHSFDYWSAIKDQAIAFLNSNQ